VDLRGVLRAFKENIRSGRLLRSPQGGSTITQQLARLLFLYPQQTIGRKLKEMYLSLQIEKQYSKEKILEMYCNQFYLNHGVYGVETASNFYFGKSVADLTLEEAALIAGIFRGPSLYSPYTNVDTTLRRRNHVLNRMVEEGYITNAQGEEAKARPMAVLPWRRGSSDFAAYFFEEVRKYIEKDSRSTPLSTRGSRDTPRRRCSRGCERWINVKGGAKTRGTFSKKEKRRSRKNGSIAG
jgi:penicillin-binding protein 1A